MQRSEYLRIVLAAGLLGAGCATPPSSLAGPKPVDDVVITPSQALAPSEARDTELDADWASEGELRFEARVSSLATGPPLSWSSEALESLSAGLNDPGTRATRAAVLLALDPRDTTSEILLQSLEARHVAPARGLDAGDILAAAALGQRALDGDTIARLLALVNGTRPHPDLEVRVECAATLLGAGMAEEGVAAFLLRVLRAETPAQASDPIDWERVETMSWSKSRAAAALAAHLRLPNDFHPDSPWQEQIDIAARWEAAL